jgi:hypothetical protein
LKKAAPPASKPAIGTVCLSCTPDSA